MKNKFPFIKYNSIENTYQTEFINKIKIEQLDYGDWIVTEKIHGANFSFWINDFNIRTAKRSCLISDTENVFYNNLDIKEKYKSNCINLFDDIKDIYHDDSISVVVIYGEIFGGNYPHKDIPKNKFSKSIQKGIFYSPNNDFISFDIGIIFKDDKFEYIKYTDAVELLKNNNLLYAEPLFIGTLDECLEYHNEFQTTIPDKLGLPNIENNICEGIVIKPDYSRFLKNGKRIILKNKNDKYTEKTKKVKKDPVKLSNIGEEIKDEYLSLININRLNNVISHIGNIKMEDFGLLMKNMMIDINEDFNKNIELKTKLDQLEKKEQKAITKIVSQKISELIKSNIKDIIKNQN